MGEKKMKRNEKRLAIAGMTGGLMLATAAAPPARAALVLTLQEFGVVGTPITITDNGPGDTDTDVGTITTVNVGGAPTLPDFRTVISVAVSNKLDPSAGPEADLFAQSIDVTQIGNSGPHSLIVNVSDNAFPFPGNSGDLMMLSSALSGNVTHSVAGSGDNVTFTSTANGSVNTPLITGVLPPNSGSAPLSWTGAPSSTSNTFVRGATFDLSNTTTLNLSGSNESVQFQGTTSAVSLGPNVPEPTGILALLAGAPLLLGGRRRRMPR
jgi:hypothetical protein